jgi:hypothetical protein
MTIQLIHLTFAMRGLPNISICTVCNADPHKAATIDAEPHSKTTTPLQRSQLLLSGNFFPNNP